MQTISAKDLRLNHPEWRDERYITIDDKRYMVGRYFPRDDCYELIEQVKASADQSPK